MTGRPWATALALHPRAVDEARMTSGGSASAMELLTDDAAVEPIFCRLAARAGALGFALPTRRPTANPALRLVVGGCEIAPVYAAPDRVVSRCPATPGWPVWCRAPRRRARCARGWTMAAVSACG